MSERTAYRLLDVHKQFGGYESLPQWQTLPRSVLYLLAAPSTPDEAREEAIERVEAGERLTLAEVKEKIVAAHDAVISISTTSTTLDFKSGQLFEQNLLDRRRDRGRGNN